MGDHVMSEYKANWPQDGYDVILTYILDDILLKADIKYSVLLVAEYQGIFEKHPKLERNIYDRLKTRLSPVDAIHKLGYGEWFNLYALNFKADSETQKREVDNSVIAQGHELDKDSLPSEGFYFK